MTAIVKSSVAFHFLYISRWWRQTLNLCLYITVIGQSEVRVSTEHGMQTKLHCSFLAVLSYASGLNLDLSQSYIEFTTRWGQWYAFWNTMWLLIQRWQHNFGWSAVGVIKRMSSYIPFKNYTHAKTSISLPQKSLLVNEVPIHLNTFYLPHMCFTHKSQPSCLEKILTSSNQ